MGDERVPVQGSECRPCGRAEMRPMKIKEICRRTVRAKREAGRDASLSRCVDVPARGVELSGNGGEQPDAPGPLAERSIDECSLRGAFQPQAITIGVEIESACDAVIPFCV